MSATVHALDRATVWLERPVRRLAGSARLNPLPHAGTISVFLLAVVVVTGLYITLFFEYGHVASYESVASMEQHAIQKVVRALHRYSSAALVVTTLVHSWRIFTARRFVGRQRRCRWATGISALVLVWLAGVTGYWLIWDVRAQALNEVMIGLVGSTGSGADAAIDQLGVLGQVSGSGFLLFLWFVHLLLTVVIGYFVHRHVRRTTLPWLPPRHWMALLGGALVLVSLAVPVGMLPPAQPDQLIGDIPLDPFVLFLLPPLLSGARWLVLAVALVLLVVALLLPRLLRRRDPETVIIDEAACTGCELCVVDCPYQALEMGPRSAAGPGVRADDGGTVGGRGPAIAAVDPELCVSCGICLGSCAFGAIDLPGWDPTPPLEVEGRHLVIACDRHDEPVGLGPGSGGGSDVLIHRVRCAGALAPDAIRRFAERGATDVQLIGCAPSECRYGIGNQLASDRMAGTRRPHPAARHARKVAVDWVPTDRFEQALADPGAHPSADAATAPARREALIGAGLIVAATAIGVAFATRAPFRSDADGLAIRVVVDHEPGRVLRSIPGAGPRGPLTTVELELDREVVATIERSGSGGDWTEIIDLEPGTGAESPGVGSLAVYAVDGSSTRSLLYEESVTTRPGRRILVDLTDVPPQSTVADGERIFNSRLGGCDVCHSVDRGADGVGPTLYGVASTGGDRVDGLDAEGYLRQSILLPDQYIVPGWPSGQMLPIYRDRFSEEELDAVIGYLLTLEDPDADGPDTGGTNDGNGEDS